MNYRERFFNTGIVLGKFINKNLKSGYENAEMARIYKPWVNTNKGEQSIFSL